jgi:PAS domain S-box-containing protein
MVRIADAIVNPLAVTDYERLPTAMKRQCRILIVEDSPDDAKLMLNALQRGGIDPVWERVETADGLRAALASGPWDAILADYDLPGFGARAALEIVRAVDQDLPFLVLSETVGEEPAVEMMQAGASDYVLRRNLARLARAVEREVGKAETRLEKQAARRAAAQLAAVVESSEDAIISETIDGVITTWNRSAERLYGWTAAEAIGRHISLCVPPEKREELAGILDRLRAGERVESLETVRMHRDGRRIDVSLMVSPVKDADGRVIGVSKIARDIRERKRLEEARRASEERYRGLLESLPALIWVYDAKGRPLMHNRQWYEYTGQSVGDVAAGRWHDVLHPDDVAEAVATWERSKTSGEPYSVEYRIRRADGVYRWFLGQGMAYRGPGGIEQWSGICTDIDDRKRAEQELRRTAALLTAVTEGTTDAVFVKDRDGRYLLCNPAAASFMGRSAAEVLGRTDAAFFDNGSASLVRDGDRHVMESGLIDTKEEELTVGGVTRTFQAIKAPYRDGSGNIAGVVGISRDITESRRLAAQRDELLGRLQLHIERMPLAYILFDADFRITDWNPAAGRIFGYSKAEALGMTPFDLIPSSFQDEGTELLSRIRTGDMMAHSVNENLTKDGRTITCEWFNTPLLTEDGQFCGLLCLASDVTERQRLETRFRETQERLRHVVASSPAVLYILAGEGENLRPSWVSENVQDMLGYPVEEVYQPNWWDEHVHPDDLRQTWAEIQNNLFTHGQAVDELRFRHRDGTWHWIRCELRLLRDPAGQPLEVVGSWSDITARKVLEAQFHQAQKMEAFGQLAGGVAHDFNNMLTIINGYSDLLLQRLAPGDPSRDLAAEIHKAGERSASLTRQLLAFSRQQILAPRLLDLNAVITDTEKMLHRLIGEDVRIVTTLEPSLWAVWADPGQIDQVLINLAVNARDAMPLGGRLTIETQNVELDETYVRTHADARAGRHVRLSVTDTGTGIAPELMGKIFEPFFTTKGVGKGTGLGLATVYGIVRQSGGHIGVYSEVGIGTSFKVYLPWAEHAIPEANIRPVPPAAERRTETVLLAEDEEEVRAFIHHVLTECGYTVLTAADGNEAVALADRHVGPIHLLITDVVMPGTGGRAVAERLAERHAGMQVLFVSGYTDDSVIRHGVLPEGASFLQKPFTSVALAIKVKEVLDARTQTGDG